MKEEQRNLTLGQVADMKQVLEDNIKNQLTEFMKQTGIDGIQINGWCCTSKNVVDKTDTVEITIDSNIIINITNFLNR